MPIRWATKENCSNYQILTKNRLRLYRICKVSISSFAMVFDKNGKKTASAILFFLTSNVLTIWTTLYPLFPYVHCHFPYDNYLAVNRINTRNDFEKWKKDQRSVGSWVFWYSKRFKRSRMPLTSFIVLLKPNFKITLLSQLTWTSCFLMYVFEFQLNIKKLKSTWF